MKVCFIVHKRPKFWKHWDETHLCLGWAIWYLFGMKHKKGLQKNPSQAVSFLHDEIDLNYEPHFEGHIWTPSSGYFCFHVSLAGEQLHHMPSHLRRRFHPFFRRRTELRGYGIMGSFPPSSDMDRFGFGHFWWFSFPCLLEALSFRDLQTHCCCRIAVLKPSSYPKGTLTYEDALILQPVYSSPTMFDHTDKKYIWPSAQPLASCTFARHIVGKIWPSFAHCSSRYAPAR